jgi:hypothetical protein
MRPNTFVIAVLLSTGALGVDHAMAGEMAPELPATATRSNDSAPTRDQVISELRAAQARGDWHPAGEMGEAPILRSPATDAGTSASRAEVVANLREAQKHQAWKPAGEIGDQQVVSRAEAIGGVGRTSRQWVVAELRDAQARGLWHPVGEIGDAPVVQEIQQEIALARGQKRANVADGLAAANRADR